mmetsp:Transcript_96879/g.277000  ORF Transcript_96879/g.277000 Transcript_96879/m.277000 type:complete len:213 (+) Transcript_96879:752-1390(+)
MDRLTPYGNRYTHSSIAAYPTYLGCGTPDPAVGTQQPRGTRHPTPDIYYPFLGVLFFFTINQTFGNLFGVLNAFGKGRCTAAPPHRRTAAPPHRRTAAPSDRRPTTTRDGGCRARARVQELLALGVLSGEDGRRTAVQLDRPSHLRLYCVLFGRAQPGAGGLPLLYCHPYSHRVLRCWPGTRRNVGLAEPRGGGRAGTNHCGAHDLDGRLLH